MSSNLRRTLGAIRRKPRQIYSDYLFMKQLKRKETTSKRIFYFGVPEHSNLGDLAQCYCIRKLLADEFSDYEVSEIPSRIYLTNSFGCREYLKKIVKLVDIFVFQSGYCTQDIGGNEDIMHQNVLQDFSENKMIMMPQTVFFKSQERKQQASRIYGAHKHLTFLARDQVSYELAKEMFPDIPVLSYPDIVTTLIGEYQYSYERQGILLCLRNDSEKYYLDEELSVLQEKLSTFDKIERLDTSIRVEYYRILENLRYYIEGYFDKFAHYKVIITDRYHGTIFSLVSNTPVIVIQTNDHKVKTGVDWFKGIYDNQVYFASSLDEAEELSKTILAGCEYKMNEAYFMEKYYKKLRKLIEL